MKPESTTIISSSSDCTVIMTMKVEAKPEEAKKHKLKEENDAVPDPHDPDLYKIPEAVSAKESMANMKKWEKQGSLYTLTYLRNHLIC